MKSKMLVSLMAALALTCNSCSQEKTTAYAAAPSSHASSPADEKPANAAKAEKLEEDFVASGPVTVENQVDLAALREGVIAQISTEAGSYVRKGDLLAKLDDRQIAADVDAADARVRSIAANLKNWEAETKVFLADRQRAEKMWEANLITKQDLDHAVYKQEADVFEVQRESESLKTAQAMARSLQLEKEKTQIRAPFDGVIARRYIHLGQKVALGDRLFWLTATSPLRIRFTVPQRLVDRIHAGESVNITAAELAGKPHAGKIIFVSPVVDPASGTLDVVAELVGAPRELRPGMQASVRLPIRP